MLPVRRKLPIPASCADLDLDVVERVLAKHDGHVYEAARELGVPSPDLRRLTWSVPRLIDAALERAERLVDRAEANPPEPTPHLGFRVARTLAP
jgi:hypothetical protein